MKKWILAATLMGTFSVFAQQTVFLRINHQLNGSAFNYNTQVATGSGEVLSLSRMEYYLADFSITHDGGQVTHFPGMYALVQAGVPTEIDLGTANFTTLESISFGVGVDSINNHADPALYPSDHPLSPKIPSMHWGWAAGYRFVAMEGEVGTTTTDMMEIHALGDQNYFLQTIATPGATIAGNHIIELNADYLQALNGISIAGGFIYHGFGSQAATLLSNFSTSVFTATTPVGGIGLAEAAPASFSLLPNPSTGTSLVQFSTPQTGNLLITDLTGREVARYSLTNQTELPVQLSKAGIYLVQVINNGQTSVQKLVIQ